MTDQDDVDIGQIGAFGNDDEIGGGLFGIEGNGGSSTGFNDFFDEVSCEEDTNPRDNDDNESAEEECQVSAGKLTLNAMQAQQQQLAQNQGEEESED